MSFTRTKWDERKEKEKKTKREKKDSLIFDREEEKKKKNIWIDRNRETTWLADRRRIITMPAGVARDGPRSNKPFRQCLLHTTLQLC